MGVGLQCVLFSLDCLKYPIIPEPHERWPTLAPCPRRVRGSRSHYDKVEGEFPPAWQRFHRQGCGFRWGQRCTRSRREKVEQWPEGTHGTNWEHDRWTQTLSSSVSLLINVNKSCINKKGVIHSNNRLKPSGFSSCGLDKSLVESLKILYS